MKILSVAGKTVIVALVSLSMIGTPAFAKPPEGKGKPEKAEKKAAKKVKKDKKGKKERMSILLLWLWQALQWPRLVALRWITVIQVTNPCLRAYKRIWRVASRFLRELPKKWYRHGCFPVCRVMPDMNGVLPEPT